MKGRLLKEGNETVTNCYQLKLPAADGKKRLTDVADLEQTFRLIQSIPSKKAEPVKKWLAEVATTEIARHRQTKGMKESRDAAQAGGRIAKNTRDDLERQLVHSQFLMTRNSLLWWG